VIDPAANTVCSMLIPIDNIKVCAVIRILKTISFFLLYTLLILLIKDMSFIIKNSYLDLLSWGNNCWYRLVHLEEEKLAAK
jgi:hypothetical protein